jgi:hypothetical protein
VPASPEAAGTTAHRQHQRHQLRSHDCLLNGSSVGTREIGTGQPPPCQ